MDTYNLREFIAKFVIPDVEKMLSTELHYYAVSVICQSIEVLGSVFDQKEIDDYGMCEKRFDSALSNLFNDDRYRAWKGKLFEFLRAPLIHQIRPGSEFIITSTRRDETDPENHFQKDSNGRVILVVERFYGDFRRAFDAFNRILDKRADLDRRKVEAPFIFVGTVGMPIPVKSWDKDTGERIVSQANGTGVFIR